MVNSTLSARLRTIIDELDINQTKLATEAGATKGAASQWLNGLTKSIDPEYAFKLQRRTGYSAEWIMFGTGPKKLLETYRIGSRETAMLKCMENMTEADKDRLVKIGSALAQPTDGNNGSKNTGG